MKKMAKWGKHSFSVSSKRALSFDDFQTSAEEKKKDSESKKKKLELEEISFTFKCVRAAGVNPRAEFNAWKEDIGKANALYIAGKKWKTNKMKLIKVSISGVIHDDLGRFLAADITVNFKEINKKKKANGKKATATKEDRQSKKVKKVKKKK